jgi:hypothetical protein
MPDDNEQLSKELFLATIHPIRDQISELVTRQRTMNGRITQAEQHIAVLNDRSPNRVGIVAGSTVLGVAGVVVAAMKLFSMLS